MTKHLFNYCTIDWYENDLLSKGTTLQDFIKEFELDATTLQALPLQVQLLHLTLTV